MTEYAFSENALPEAYVLEAESTQASQKLILSHQQQIALMNLVKVDDPVAKQQVIAHNLRLVVNIAKRYSDRGVALLDLIRVGTMGLFMRWKTSSWKAVFVSRTMLRSVCART